MQHTWFVNKTYNLDKFLLLIWYYQFLFFSYSLLYFKLANIKILCLQYLCNYFKFTNALLNPKSKIKYSYFFLKTKIKRPIIRTLKTKFFKPFNNSIKKFNNNISLKYNLNLFFLINQARDPRKYKAHAQFRLFYLYVNSSNDLIFDPTKFFQKWNEIYVLLFNLFYYKHLPLLFSSKFFKKETLALNWFLNLFELSTWRYLSFFFTFSISLYNRKLNLFFKKLKKQTLSMAILTDVEYHYKLLFYLTKYKWFTLALIPANVNPWYVSYALPILKNNFYLQFFFLKFLLSIKKTANFEHFNTIKRLWYYHKRQSFLIH